MNVFENENKQQILEIDVFMTIKIAQTICPPFRCRHDYDANWNGKTRSEFSLSHIHRRYGIYISLFSLTHSLTHSNSSLICLFYPHPQSIATTTTKSINYNYIHFLKTKIDIVLLNVVEKKKCIESNYAIMPMCCAS